jgi:hypothetical protein
VAVAGAAPSHSWGRRRPRTKLLRDGRRVEASRALGEEVAGAAELSGTEARKGSPAAPW